MVKFSLLTVALTAFLAAAVNGENWSVQVGEGGKNVYTPKNFDAVVGDLVVFSFVNGSHDVIQSDYTGSCTKSVQPKTFSTEETAGNAKSPPQSTWNLTTAGTVFYYCGVARHCSEDSMYGQIRVLEEGKKPETTGVKATLSATSSTVAPTATSSTPTSSQTTPPKNNANADKQISSVAVVGGALLSLAAYFL